MSTVTEKVAKLLAKAQATDFAEEAEAFMAKAQALMTEHGITRAMAESAGQVQQDEITSKMIRFDAPYANGKMMMAYQMAVKVFGLKGVRVSNSRNHSTIHFFGTKTNLDNFETMLATAQVHMTQEMLKAPIPPGVHGKTFRSAFLDGYGSKISAILLDAKRVARKATEETATSDEVKGVSLVLVSEAERVKDAVKEAYPSTHTSRTYRSTSYGSGAGRNAGSTAATRFNGHRAGVGGGVRGALS